MALSSRPAGETIGLAVGDTRIGLHCADREFVRWAVQSYEPFLSDREPDFCLEMSITEHLTRQEIEARLPGLTMFVAGDSFHMEPRLMSGRVDWAGGSMTLDVERDVLRPDAPYRATNLVLRGVYYGIHKRVWKRPPNAYLIHGCGVADRGHGFLFAGPPDAGKTTVARLAGERTVLNDEAVLLGLDSAGFFLRGTPFQGGVRKRSDEACPLEAILFLKHESEPSLRPLRKAEAFWRFLAQTLDVSPWLDSRDRSLGERKELSAQVVEEVPCFELGFRPDASFWPVVEGLRSCCAR